MTVFRARPLHVFVVLAALAVTGPVIAQSDGRDASFLPPAVGPAVAEPTGAAPVPILPSVQVPVVAPAPTAIVPAVATAPVTPAPIAFVPAVAPVIVTSPVVITAPVASTVPVVPVAPTSPLAVPAAILAAPPALIPPPVAAPTDLGAIDAESIGLIGTNDGGLGAAMWKGTPRALAERLLPGLSLPLASPALNNLARRFLLTTASVPEGKPTGESLTSLRIEKLTALGDVAAAWKLAMLAKPEQVDDITLRMTAEYALLSPAREDVCAKLPELIKMHGAVEWQKSLLVCQLRANDTKAAQLTLDLLHAQGVKDDNFFYIAEKNVLTAGKQFPRQLTPLKPLTLALMRMVALPLPGEIFVRPDAALIPELLAGKPREDVTRWGLAERAAERGLVDGATLMDVYKTSAFPPDILASASNTPETGPRLHALLYQAALNEKTPQAKIVLAAKYMATASAALLNGAGAEVLADMVKDVPANAEANAASGMIAHTYVLAGHADAALEWVKAARHAAIGMPPVTAELQSFWPLLVFGGLEASGDYSQDLSKWIDAALRMTDPKADARAQRELAAGILLLLEADGFAVTDEEWARVLNVPAFERRTAPPAPLLERLQMAGEAKRRGEAVLLSLALASNGSDTPLLVTADIIRSLREAGLTADAGLLAKETAALLLAPK